MVLSCCCHLRRSLDVNRINVTLARAVSHHRHHLPITAHCKNSRSICSSGAFTRSPSPRPPQCTILTKVHNRRTLLWHQAVFHLPVPIYKPIKPYMQDLGGVGTPARPVVFGRSMGFTVSVRLRIEWNRTPRDSRGISRTVVVQIIILPLFYCSNKTSASPLHNV